MSAPEFLTERTFVRSQSSRHTSLFWRTSGWLLGAALLGAAGIAAFTTLPPGLFLPALAVLLTGAGFSLAAGLFLTGARIGDGSGIGWQVAGALVFLGFAAALLGDSEQALRVFERLAT